MSGFAYAVGLKHDAERAVKRIAGVDDVNDQIEELPLSQFDDDLRWRAFYAIYTNAFLSRYAPGGGLLWGHRDGLRWRQVPGLEPIGNYPIHIIVKGGRIQLLGVVDSEADRTAANLAARGVSGSFRRGQPDHRAPLDDVIDENPCRREIKVNPRCASHARRMRDGGHRGSIAPFPFGPALVDTADVVFSGGDGIRCCPGIRARLAPVRVLRTGLPAAARRR